MTTTRCPACHNLVQSPTERPDLPWYRCHKPDCPDATIEDMRAAVRAFEAKSKRDYERWADTLPWRNTVELKYRRVKEENNALRKKLYPGKPPVQAPVKYSGHTPCAKCGTTHWMHGPCPTPP